MALSGGPGRVCLDRPGDVLHRRIEKGGVVLPDAPPGARLARPGARVAGIARSSARFRPTGRPD
jgi:hypothetical protein